MPAMPGPGSHHHDDAHDQYRAADDADGDALCDLVGPEQGVLVVEHNERPDDGCGRHFT